MQRELKAMSLSKNRLKIVATHYCTWLYVLINTKFSVYDTTTTTIYVATTTTTSTNTNDATTATTANDVTTATATNC